jgi:precorrin-6Y C5,15-methyltransferase (decarboxylating)
MKKIYVIGAGLGISSLGSNALGIIEKAAVCFGAPRLLENINGTKFPYYQSDDIKTIIEGNAGETFAVLVSGDTGFYSAAEKINAELDGYDIEFIPGISSVSVFFARLKMQWQDAVLFSAHGRDAAALSALVRRNKKVFCLTGGNANLLAQELCKAGFEELTVYTGENLGTDNERIYHIKISELANNNLPVLTVLLIINDNANDGIHTGLNDCDFIRGENIPMTKSEIRSVALSKLALKPDDVCYDIGAGTGSVSVEMALSAWRGAVFAVERCGRAARLIKNNCKKFHVGNVTVIEGEAPEALKELPAPDIIFIGGSGGNLAEIIALCRTKNNKARIVLTAISLESAHTAIKNLENAEITWLSVARSKTIDNKNNKNNENHIFMGRNPIMIISEGGSAV